MRNGYLIRPAILLEMILEDYVKRNRRSGEIIQRSCLLS